MLTSLAPVFYRDVPAKYTKGIYQGDRLHDTSKVYHGTCPPATSDPDPPKNFRYGSEQDHDQEDRTQIPDREFKDFSSAEDMSALLHLPDDLPGTDPSRDHQADTKRCNGHHYRVRQKIREVKEGHPGELDHSQWPVAKRRKGSKNQHDPCHDAGRQLPVHPEFIIHCRNRY